MRKMFFFFLLILLIATCAKKEYKVSVENATSYTILGTWDYEEFEVKKNNYIFLGHYEERIYQWKIKYICNDGNPHCPSSEIDSGELYLDRNRRCHIYIDDCEKFRLSWH